MREVPHLVVLQTHVEGREVLFAELFRGDAARPGPSVGFRLAGQDALPVHLGDADAVGDEGCGCHGGVGGGRGGKAPLHGD